MRKACSEFLHVRLISSTLTWMIEEEEEPEPEIDDEIRYDSKKKHVRYTMRVLAFLTG